MSGRMARVRRWRWRREPVDRQAQQRGRPSPTGGRDHEYNLVIDRAFARAQAQAERERLEDAREPRGGPAVESEDCGAD